jgi:hypothetical protein
VDILFRFAPFMLNVLAIPNEMQTKFPSGKNQDKMQIKRQQFFSQMIVAAQCLLMLNDVFVRPFLGR